MKLFEKIYEGEDMYDFENDMTEYLNTRFEKDPDGIPFDEEGLLTGTFKITVNWEPF